MATPTTNYASLQTPTQPPTQTQQSIQLALEDYQLFPLVLDIISRIKDDEIDLIRAINLTNERKQKALINFSKLPGINRSLEEQEKLLKQHKLTLKKKVELLEKLKKLELFQRYNKADQDTEMNHDNPDSNNDSNNNDTNNQNNNNNNNNDDEPQQNTTIQESQESQESQQSTTDNTSSTTPESTNKEAEEDIMKE